MGGDSINGGLSNLPQLEFSIKTNEATQRRGGILTTDEHMRRCTTPPPHPPLLHALCEVMNGQYVFKIK